MSSTHTHNRQNIHTDTETWYKGKTDINRGAENCQSELLQTVPSVSSPQCALMGIDRLGLSAIFSALRGRLVGWLVGWFVSIVNLFDWLIAIKQHDYSIYCLHLKLVFHFFFWWDRKFAVIPLARLQRLHLRRTSFPCAAAHLWAGEPAHHQGFGTSFSLRAEGFLLREARVWYFTWSPGMHHAKLEWSTVY